MNGTLAWLGFAAAAVFAAPPKATVATGAVEIDYVGHACFVVRSPLGLDVVIDPYNGKRWLGYGFPEDVAADLVLVTHPHYDHDASYYWGDGVPVFREPGRYAVRDVVLVGVEGRHAGDYGKDFGHKNTIWVVETGGLRLSHLGDNGPLTAENLREIGRVDVLMIPADGLGHILASEEIEAIRRSLEPKAVIPMHYRLDGLLGLPASLGPIDPWLETQKNVVRVGTNRASFTAPLSPLSNAPRVMVLEPSPSLRAWPEALASAWRKLDEARALMGRDASALPQAAALVREAYELGDGIAFAFQWASALHRSGRGEEAIPVLEAALAAAQRDDWEYRMRAHSLLAELYHARGLEREAAEQHRIVLHSRYRADLVEKARAYLSSPSR